MKLILVILLPLLWLAYPCQAQEVQEVSREGVEAILKGPGLQRTGAAKPDITLVEYFDYNCPYCKRVVPTFKQLLTEDKKLAIIYKDWPVLGDASVYAARCALAANWQGKYLIAHDALLTGPRLANNPQIEALLRAAGVDVDRLRKDLTTYAAEISATLARNDAEAHALDLDGTPGIVVGKQLLPGGAELGFFQQLIASERKSPAPAH